MRPAVAMMPTLSQASNAEFDAAVLDAMGDALEHALALEMPPDDDEPMVAVLPPE